jgi:PAS domain S-box-containing protein
MMEGCQIIGFDWRYLFVNKAVAEQGRIPKEKLLGNTMMEMYPGIERKDMFIRLKLCMEKRISQRMDTEFVFADGSIGWFDLSVQPVPEGIFVLSVDVTERKIAEAALVKARDELESRVLERTAELNTSNESLEFERRRFHEVLDVLPAYVILLTPDYHVPFANRFFIERFGESNGKRCYEYLFGRTEPCEICETYTVLRTRSRHEWEWTGPDGCNYYIYDFPFTDADGSPLILEMGIDVTERKLTEAELEKHRNHLEELVKSRTRELEAANTKLHKEIAVRTQVEALTRLQNSVLDGINRILHASMTCTSEEELGRFCLSVVEEVTQSKFGFVGEINPGGRLDDIAVSDSWWSVYFQTNPGAERAVQKDLLIRGIFGRVLNEGKSIFTNDPASHPDSVDLPAWHPRLDSFLGVPLVLAGDTIGMVGVANREGGYNEEYKEALVSMSAAIVEAFSRFRAERALRESEEQYRSLFNGMTEGFALHEIILDDDGKPCDYRFIEINPAFVRLTGLAREDVVGKLARNLLPIAHRGLIEIYDEVARTGNPIHSESYFPRLKKHFEVFAYSPARTLVAVQLMDITERKKAEEILKRDKETFERLVAERTQELVEAQARLAHAKRLSDIGTLSSTVAHELRNPLAVISMAASNIKRKAKDQSMDRSLANIQKKIAESNQIITNLLFYSRLRVPQYENVSVRELILESVETAKTHLVGKAAIRMDIDSIRGVSIEADSLQLREVLTNLLNNALDAVQDVSGRIVVSSNVSGGSISISVEDNGVGIPAVEIDKIFEPFFTTKTKGTGLGLTVCDQVIRMHGGRIEVKSDPATGTVFAVTLPCKRVDAD